MGMNVRGDEVWVGYPGEFIAFHSKMYLNSSDNPEADVVRPNKGSKKIQLH